MIDNNPVKNPKVREKISQTLKGRHCSPQSEFKKGHKLRAGMKHSEESKQKMSKARKGKPAWNKGLHGYNKGSKNPNWKGGLSRKKRSANLLEYRQWREAVFKRDNWTCQECQKRGGDLEAHHIKAFYKYPKLRFEISNGQTLCIICHMKIDKHRNNFNSNGKEQPTR